MFKSYHATTLGPIYQTFRNARRTREVWAASYLFSYLAKGIIIRSCLPNFEGHQYGSLTQEQIVAIIQKSDSFVLPNISDPELFKAKAGVGLFPDRILFASELLGTRNYQEIIDAVLLDIAQMMSSDTPAQQQTGYTFLKGYLRIDWGIFEVEEKENPIIKISPFLDSFELSPQFVSLESTNPLFAFLADVQKNGFLVEHYEEQDANGNVRFESLVEIATRGLQAEPIYRRNFNAYNWQNPKPEDEDKAEADFMEILSQDRTVFRSYHKYICIVKADGDKIGQTLKKIHGEKLIQFSKKLLNWGLAAKDKIRAFGGVPIYVGGDDLLFFAPVCTAAGTIIDLLDSIDTVFADQQWHEISQEVTPSLSYGLSISYYKFPLGEAIQKADALLYDAKRAGGNAVALKLLKHSGSEFEMVLQKSDSLYHYHFKNLLKRMVSDKAFLNSVGFKLRDNQSLIGHIAQDAVRMENLFHNVFDERATNRQDTDEYLKEVRELVTYSFGQHQNVVEESMKEVFSLIRTSKFINGLEEIKS